MRSFYVDDDSTKFNQEIKPTMIKSEYTEYIAKCNDHLQHNPEQPERPKVPSETWICDDNNVEGTSLKRYDMDENDEEGMRDEVINVGKKDSCFSDENIQEIMKQRYDNDGSAEYLTELGQKVRHDFLEGLMFQLIQVQEYHNKSHYRMHKLMMGICITELMMEGAGIVISHATDRECIANEYAVAKETIAVGLNWFIQKYGFEMHHMVREAVVIQHQEERDEEM